MLKEGKYTFNNFFQILSNTDKCRDLLWMALEGKNGSEKELSEVIGAPKESVEKAIENLKEMLVKQAEENGVTLKELINNLKG